MKKFRIIVLMHRDLVPPEDLKGIDITAVNWKTEYDVVSTLEDLEQEVIPVGVLGDLEVIRRAINEHRPHIVFNLLEEFDGKSTYDQNVVSYLELKHVPYTGCNPRGLMLARDKALSKKILSYHRIPVPKFQIFPKNNKARRAKQLQFPLIVKSLIEEASLGISQASVVNNDNQLKERVEFIHKSIDTDAIAETYIKGREFYVGIYGNKRLKVLPIWEIFLNKLSGHSVPIATNRAKWSDKYRKKYGIKSAKAADLEPGLVSRIQALCKRTYKGLGLNGYARIDIRCTDEGEVFVLEANPNPAIAYGEEFPESAEWAKISYEEIIWRIVNLGLSWHERRA